MKLPRFWIVGLCMVLAASSGCAGPATDSPADTGPMLLEDTRAGMDVLTGYHAHVVNEFSGTQDGKEQSSRLEMTADMDRSTDSLFVEQIQTAAGGQIRTMVEGKAGNAAYSRVGDPSARCHVSWSANSQPPATLPMDVVPAVVSAQEAGEEEVNGVAALRYTLNADSLGTDIENLQGSLWLAKTGRFVVRLDLTYSGGEETFGKGRSGKQTIAYNLTKINSNTGFTLPAGCEPVLAGVPEMPGAKNVTRLPDTLRYSIDSTPETVFKFYGEHLAPAGWRAGEAHTMTSGDTAALFTRTDSPESLRILLSKGNTGITVSIAKLKAVTAPSGDKPAVDADEESQPADPLDPAEAGLPEGVTVYPGSADFTGYEGIRLEFNAPDDTDAVKEYYRSGLKKAGWTAMPGSESMADVPMMLQKDNLKLFIVVSKNEMGSRVEITWMNH